MDVVAARSLLGVTADDDWATVRDAYRTLVRRSHPDLVGDGGIDRTVQVNAAYRSLAIARRQGRLHDDNNDDATSSETAPSRTPPRVPDVDVIADDVRMIGSDTIVLSSPPAEAFRRLVEAVHTLGDISYIDRGSAIFEAVLSLEDGHHASFVVSLQWRAHDASCEAFCTLEALDRAEHLDVSGVIEQLLPMIPPDRESESPP